MLWRKVCPQQRFVTESTAKDSTWDSYLLQETKGVLLQLAEGTAPKLTLEKPRSRIPTLS